MITYIKMKLKEHRIKLALYSSIEKVMDEKSDIIDEIYYRPCGSNSQWH